MKTLYSFLFLITVINTVHASPLTVLDIKGKTISLDSVTPPKTISIDEMPKPKIIEVPTKKEGSYIRKKGGKEETIELSPPEVKPAVPYYFMKNYTNEDGLPTELITSLFIDKEGILWIGTNGGGLTRYDGKSFAVFSISSYVSDIIQDRKGNLWISSLNGVWKYNGQDYITLNVKDGLVHNQVNTINKDKEGNLWIATFNGVSKYDGNTFTNFTTKEGLVGNIVLFILQDRKGIIWFATDKGLSKYDGKTFTSVTVAQGLANNDVRHILEDASGNLWFATAEGVSRYDGENFINYSIKQGLPSNDIRWTIQDKKGNLVFATGNGFSYFNGKSFTNYTKENGLIDDNIKQIIEDRNGNLWIATTKGLVQFDGTAFTNFIKEQGIFKFDVRGILEDKNGKLWFATSGAGAIQYDGTSFTIYTENQGLASNPLYAIMQDKEGTLWMGSGSKTGDGVSRFDGKSFTNYTTEQGLAGNIIRFILEDRKGNLWFATGGNGVSRFDGKTFTNYTREQGLADEYVFSIFEDSKGVLWFGTYNGLSKFDGKSFTKFTSEEGFPAKSIMDILEDSKGNIWFATDRGVARYDGKTFIFFTEFQGANNFHTTTIGVNKEGYLLFGPTQTLDVLTGFKLDSKSVESQNSLPNDELAFYTPQLEFFDEKKGYPYFHATAGQHTTFLDSKGVVWIGTITAKTDLIRFDYEALHLNTEPPHVLIREIKIDDENINWNKLFSDDDFNKFKFDGLTNIYNVPEDLKLKYENNDISFDFAAIELAKPQNVLYQYKLEGYDGDWRKPTHESKALYSNLFEGNYHFKVRAKTPYSQWSEPITYSFKIAPPWYRTWLAYACYAIAAMLVIYLIVEWRTKHLKQRQRELEQIVKERTAEVVHEKQKSDELLLNILPVSVAEELKEKGTAKTRTYDEATIIFTDFKNFTKISEKLSAEELVKEIDYCFRGFDKIISKYPIEKIKTIGDSYMAAGGLPEENHTNPKDVVNAALEIVNFMEEHKEKRRREGKEVFEIRVGVNTGSVIAGVVGFKKFAYDIWGDAVNLASRMESTDEPGKVNISASTYELVKNDFDCISRGKIQVKGKGEIEMYFVTGKK